ncbi:MAG: dethiobiotin synthase, partial [Anaerovoracaceae bacterium]
GDAEVVKALGGFSDKNEEMVSYVYQRAVSPHLAARIEGNPVELHVVKRDYQRQKEKYDLVAVEGSGGIVCPLRMDEGNELFLEDVIKGLGLSTLVVADGGLGTINAVVLTIAYMRQQAIPVKGIILNRYQKGDLLHEDNRRMIEACTKVPVIGTVALEGKEIELEAEKLASLFQ